MPLYQYKCRHCDESFERRLRMSQSGEPQACPECGSDETRKLLGSFAVGGSSKSASRPSARPVTSPFT